MVGCRRLMLLAWCLLVAAEVSYRTKDSLVALYNSTRGPSWNHHDNWPSGDPCDDSWYGVVCSADKTTVTRLNLNGNNLRGPLPDLDIPSLTDLELNSNSINGIIPEWNNLPNLQTMRLFDNLIQGPLPEWNCLTNLKSMVLNNNVINGTLPQWNNLSSLTQIQLQYNSISGALPEWNGLQRLNTINMNDNLISGPLPKWDALRSLQYMNVYNNLITGTLPEWNNLQNLQNMYLQTNSIKGTLPEWSNLQKLEYMYLNNNFINGTLPEWKNLRKLAETRLQWNLISGTVPEWEDLQSLQHIYLSNQSINGTLPQRSLPWAYLDLSSNDLCGPLPEYPPASYIVLRYNSFDCVTPPAWCYACTCDPINGQCCPDGESLGPQGVCLSDSQSKNCSDSDYPILDPTSNSCVDSCPPGFFAQGSPPSCVACDANCATCQINADNCTSCDGTTLVFDSISHTCVFSCPNGSFAQGPTCAACDVNCVTCQGSASNCTSCDGDTILDLRNHTCIAACPDGLFAQGSPLSCAVCDTNCATCQTRASNCTSCDGYTILDPSNHSCVDLCPRGSFVKGSPPICAKCDANCATCHSKASNCTSCGGNDILDPINHTCVDSCPSGFFAKGSPPSCAPCNANCTTCQWNANNCTSCDGNHNILDSISHTCVDSCPSGSFAQGSPPSCALCDANCATCQSNASFCTSCGDAAFLYSTQNESTCVSSCPVSWYGDQGRCSECNSQCAACSGTADTCTACPPSMLLAKSSSTCVSACSFFDSQKENECAASKAKIWTIALVIAALSIGCCSCCVAAGMVAIHLRKRQTQGYEELELDAVASFKNSNLSAKDFFNDPVVKTVRWSDLRIGDPIGQGASGVVRRGVLQRSPSEIHVAIKELRMGLSELNIEEQVDFIREIRFLSILKHKNIVGFVGAAFPPDQSSLALLTELAERGSLKGLLRQNANALTFAVRKKLAIDAANGIAYLHSQKVLHRDLKLDNLLVDREWVCKVTDFGTSTNGSTLSRAMTCIGTLGYIAPEVLTKEKYSKRADVFSFGIVLFELFGGQRAFTRPPYKDMSSALLNHAIIEGKRPDVSFLSSDTIRQLIEECWHQDPKKRPELSTIIQILSSLPDDEIQYNFMEGENGFDTGEVVE